MKQEQTNLIESARQQAEGYFRRGEYYCSEAVLTTINQLLGEELPAEIVKLASGFPVGIGKSKCLCGAISGGVMALGLKYGRTEPGAKMPANSFPRSAELHDYIKEEYGSTCCRVITAKFEDFASPKRAEHCIGITGEVAAWVMSKFIEDGVLD
ncbi:C_GCAxxG_C_C family probable redox protein [Orenia metallireducens]|uniref:C_GCAxxG_C_C family probable redox protein n=1 Tax=Orenia metallireducens TaxID=1413210 RepID=A0A285GFZ2_9FIRM|nr:C-GCAxxG-C-C family protein [Orenia metallireducens]PRX30431.1 C_GCAxxG_C_C family probable redox protein [Orenia metallireducens]SNY22502.1 C_GCAxxG_C_C family probable redox protein [Orenia metallireducens]